MHEIMSFVNMFCYYQYKCQSHCLFEHASDMICSKNVWEVSREQLSCTKKVHQQIMLLQLKNILTRQIQWTIDWKRIWCGVASWKIKLSTWQLALGHCEKENFPAPPNKNWAHKNRYQGLLWWLPTVDMEDIQENRGRKIKICAKTGGEDVNNFCHA